MQLDQFKTFVRKHPSLANAVSSKQQTWQDFYNLYVLYGESNEVWAPYLNDTLASVSSSSANVGGGTFSLKNFWNFLDNMDMNELQRGIRSLQKGLGYASELFSKESGSTGTRESSYEPRPMHKYFDD